MRIALGIEYDGTRFCGWQRQRTGRSVQQTLDNALASIADHSLKTTCAGRTDTGVHATGQVVHFDTRASRDAGGWIRGTNTLLPADIRVLWSRRVDDDFHARFSARRRHYRYVILNRGQDSAVLANRACREHADLDVYRMREAAAYLLGEHDFTSFRAAACQARNPVRTVYSLDIIRTGQFIYLDIVANAFLHHMVRCIAGVLIAVGRGEQVPGWTAELLAARDRTAGGVNAPAAGLYLVGVVYEPHFGLPVSGWLPAFAGD